MSANEVFFSIHPDIVFREEDEGAFLFNPETDALRCVNRVGASIIRLLNGKNGTGSICEALNEEYDVDISDDLLRKDIDLFLEKLNELNLIEKRE